MKRRPANAGRYWVLFTRALAPQGRSTEGRQFEPSAVVLRVPWVLPRTEGKSTTSAWPPESVVVTRLAVSPSDSSTNGTFVRGGNRSTTTSTAAALGSAIRTSSVHS